MGAIKVQAGAIKVQARKYGTNANRKQIKVDGYHTKQYLLFTLFFNIVGS